MDRKYDSHKHTNRWGGALLQVPRIKPQRKTTERERKKRGGEEKVRAKKPPRTEGCTWDTERGLRAFNPHLRGDGKHRVERRRERAKIERAGKTTFMQSEGRSSFRHSDLGRTGSPPSLYPSVPKPAAATCLVTGCSLRIKRAIVREHSSQQPVKPQEPLQEQSGHVRLLMTRAKNRLFTHSCFQHTFRWGERLGGVNF